MAACVNVLVVGLLCLLAISASAQYPDSPSSPDSYPSPGSNPSPSSPYGYSFPGSLDEYEGPEGGGVPLPPTTLTCKDTDGKRPGCSSACPDRCPQQCVVLCPGCKTFCHDQVKPPPKPVPPPAMFVFGDGVLDVGNNVYLPTIGTGEAPQVSESSSGRFSNGANLADTIAMTFGFEQSPPAYMSLNGGLKMWGANYASAGAGIKNSTNGERSISLPKQLEQFNATRAQMGAKLGGDAKLRELLSKSVFLLSIGSQDLNPRWNPRTEDHPQGSVIRELAELYMDAVRSLYDMGARKVAIVNTGHIGCMPETRNYVCDQSQNDINAEFSQALPSFIPSVSSEKAGFSYSIGDFYGFATDVFADPTAFGIKNTQESCKGWGMPGPTCYKTDDYWFWDTEFITEHAAKLTAAAFYYGPSYYTEPITFKALLEKK